MEKEAMTGLVLDTSTMHSGSISTPLIFLPSLRELMGLFGRICEIFIRCGTGTLLTSLLGMRIFSSEQKSGVLSIEVYPRA